MQDPGYELRRIPLPRTPVNKPSLGALGLVGWHHTFDLSGVEQGGVGMSSEMVRWGGLASVAAAVRFVLSGILTFIVPPEGVPTSFSDYLLEVVIIVAFVLTLVAIKACMPRKDRAGATGYSGQRAPC
jgi:hypothetical protein